jgi:hypothetical protein
MGRSGVSPFLRLQLFDFEEGLAGSGGSFLDLDERSAGVWFLEN